MRINFGLEDTEIWGRSQFEMNVPVRRRAWALGGAFPNV